MRKSLQKTNRADKGKNWCFVLGTMMLNGRKTAAEHTDSYTIYGQCKQEVYNSNYGQKSGYCIMYIFWQYYFNSMITTLGTHVRTNKGDYVLWLQ